MDFIIFTNQVQFRTGWQGFAGFRALQQNHTDLCLQIFATKTLIFTIAGKQAICVCEKNLNTHRHVPSNTLLDV